MGHSRSKDTGLLDVGQGQGSSRTPAQYGDLKTSIAEGKTKMLNYLTPHGKWHIHSTYGDTMAMTTLSRGIEPLWLNDEDAAGLVRSAGR